MFSSSLEADGVAAALPYPDGFDPDMGLEGVVPDYGTEEFDEAVGSATPFVEVNDIH